MTTRTTQRRIGSTDGTVTGLDELEQSLRIILRTPIRSVPGRPWFGIDLTDIVDASPADLAPRVAVEVPRAVRASDPRIQVQSASVVDIGSDGRIVLRILWGPTGGAAVRTTDVEVVP